MNKLLFPLFCFISSFAYSQDTTITTTTTVYRSNDFKRNNLNLRIGPEVGFAVGDFSKTHNTGVGLSATLDIPVARRFSLVFYAAAKSFGKKDLNPEPPNFKRANLFPLRAGINYKLTPSFYASAEVGESTVQYFGVSKGSISQAIGLGYFNGYLDISARYDHEFVHGGLSSINIKAAYVITLGVRK